MGSKKKKGSKASVDIRTDAVQPVKSDMSKYARAYSNKSKINYAELKLVRSGQAKTAASSEEKKSEKDSAASADKTVKTEKKVKETKSFKDRKKANRKAKDNKAKHAPKGRNNDSKGRNEVSSAGMAAEERYSNALGKEDHYSSAIEKYYLKYPDAKRPDKSSSARRATDAAKKKKKRSSGKNTTGESKTSMAEIAVRNKGTVSVKKYARAAEKAKARGVVSPKVANKTFYRRKKKRPGALNVLMITLLLVFLASVGVTVFFNVRAINVKGDNPYGDARIKKVCSIRKGSNILFLGTDELEKKVEKELPYISECNVERRLPSSVVINVKKADVLGVVQGAAGQWSVISTEGKILETVTNLQNVMDDDTTGMVSYTPDFSNAGEFAESRKIPLLTGIDVDNHLQDGFITDTIQLGYLENFKLLKKAFENVKMRLTSVTYGNRGYEAVYDGRIVIVFGKEIDAKTVSHRLDEVHALIFDKGYIDDNEMGEIKFSSNKVYFRQAYEVSEEEVQRIHEQRHKTNREQLYSMAEIFMTAGDDWVSGKIKTED